ncbi:Adenine deaminase [Waddlia chondrophila 2032/99]|uniref:Adenine deaminase n=2 Tax=Waddlia chondrophila TaxID=71667 RepID=D6YUS7_WADCW|nr:adenine deaminase [Waddlia chondrophila]ADI37888.1 Adenine deaminase [Waddlia chondrophila WSU 86-1044]CCB91258.1 Adenine deaminase [Waddlia chondrophila 2032/99]
MTNLSISGQIVDLFAKRIFPGEITLADGRIASISEKEKAPDQYILPGFIDAHIHIESSMLIPSEFARIAVLHGTVGTISDPHEIANVAGMEGIRFMLENGSKVPFHFHFGAPSCVPATSFETAGASITADDIHTLFEKDRLKYLSEMMNFPGVLHQDPEVMQKIAVAQSFGFPIDGHSPGLKKDQAKAYINAGISTDHECFTLEEALGKILYGMKILIREGSAAKNFQALHPLIKSHPDRIMFCSDDKHPDELIEGHINLIVKRSIELGYDLMDVLRAACIHPVEHYRMNVGLLRLNDSADFIVLEDLETFNVKSTFIQGIQVASEGKSLIDSVAVSPINRFACSLKKENAFKIAAKGENIHVIQAVQGELVTGKLILPACIEKGEYISDVDKDVLKLVVVNRYQDAPPAIAFVQGLGLKSGALASSIAHDSHNIVAVGVDDQSLCRAINAVIESKGGVAAANDQIECVPLPVAGLMSDKDGWQVAADYARIKKLSHSLGSKLHDPLMTLSFLALLVIPSLKLSDLGLFDAETFQFIPLEAS